MSAALPLSVLALVPVLVGPLPAQSATITAQLCNGGTITIPLGKESAPADEGQCHPKGCHAGACREKDAPDRPKRRN
jgi:hypothetical protein